MATGTICSNLYAAAPINPRLTNNAGQGFVLGLPPQRDVGYVTDKVLVPLFLWNGTDTDAILTAVSGDDGADGITWDATPPELLPALTSLKVVIDVSLDGPLAFIGILTFVSSCSTIKLTLTGTRAPHLSGDVGYLFMPHNWENGLDELLKWSTEVLIARDRTEQRIQLRTHPRRSWDLRLLVAGAARRKLETWLSMRKTRYLFSPVWRDESRLTAPVAADSSTVYLDTPQLLDFAIGRPMAIYDAWDHFEVRTVAGIGANYVAVDTPFSKNWPAGTLVAPCRYGLAPAQRRIARFTEEAADYRLSFEAMDESLMPAIQSPELYRSVMVCPFVPAWIGPEESLDNAWLRLDNDTGLVEYDIASIEPVLGREVFFRILGRERIDLMLRFLFACAGRLAPFWLAANDRGFELAAEATGQDLTITGIDYNYSLLGSPARSHVELITTDGAVIRRMVTGVETLPGGDEKLSLDGALPIAVSAADLNRCAWLELVRLDSDEIKIHWVGGDCVEISLPIVVLP